MKKILLGILLLIIPLITFANTEDITFNLSSSLRLDENEGQIYLPNLKIDVTDHISKNLNFSLSKQDFLIFANDITKIKLNSLTANIKAINISKDNKKMEIVLNEDISGKIEIQGIQIRTYDQKIRGAKVGFDYNNDDIIDLYSTNVIDLDENGRYSDNMKPLPVSNVIKTITKNDKGLYDIEVTWVNSPDLDIYGSFIKVNKNNSYGNIKEQFIGKLNKSEFIYSNMDLENDIYKIEIYSKDFYYLNTDPFILELNKESIQNFLNDKKVEEKIIEKDINNDNSQINQTIKKTEVLIKKYNPNFINNKIYFKIAKIFDNYIERKLNKNSDIIKQNKVRKLRNELLMILEKYDIAKKKDKKGIIIEFKEKLTLFIGELK